MPDALATAQRCLTELVRTIDRLEQQVGGGLEMRRVRSDTEHLRESLSLLKEAAPRARQVPRSEMVPVPDQPYDRQLWADADDEGLGARDRHAP
ncbi:hypothetical protein E0L36_10950 [Streptomyces sp. AJS327]|uniref:hypothetical protein n=1 Tax=Streptomyces sp. AJS327 TaxID=2545265 RepID=UPI0015DDAAF9|nr:hypothetical protein [Streptomyces sp. AJS327]MBA0051387.1 hypothetical protein [Streptomyces sp. AJS327]